MNKNQPTIHQRYISLSQAAAYLGLSPKTIYEWVEVGKMPGYKLGRLWRFDRDQLDGFVKASGNKVWYTPTVAMGSERKEV